MFEQIAEPESVTASGERLRAEAEAGRAALEREQIQVGRKLAGLIDAIADGLRSPGLKDQLDQLEQRKAELARELATPSKPLPRLHPNLERKPFRLARDIRR